MQKTSESETLPVIAAKAAFSKRAGISKQGKGGGRLPAVHAGVTRSSRSSGGSGSHQPRVYRYQVLPGNNSRVILGALRLRPWWHAMPTTSQGNGHAADDHDAADLTPSNPPSFVWEMYRNRKRYQDGSFAHTILNHIQNNDCLVSKRGMYYTLRNYCEQSKDDLLSIIPRTFYLKSSSSTSSKADDLDLFKRFNDDLQLQPPPPPPPSCGTLLPAHDDTQAAASSSVDPREAAIWILKPASLTNRGFGIRVVKGLTAVMDTVNGRSRSTESHSRPENDDAVAGGGANAGMTKMASKIARQSGWIVQAYMERPLLVDGRKFDIRCFVLVTLFPKAGLHAYFFEDVYIRTSSKRYSLSKLSDRETHLTNDAVQKHSKAYGKFEAGNKLTLDEFQEAITRDYPGSSPTIAREQILPEIIRLSRLSIAAAANAMQQSSIHKSFELFGYDYMIDEAFKPYLIEINTNPCLEFACPLLTEVISSLIENVMKVALDAAAPPPSSGRTKACEEAVKQFEEEGVKFQHIFP